MNEQRAVRWIDRFSLPRYRVFRSIFRWCLLGGVLVAAPVVAVALLAGNLFVPRQAESVPAISDPIELTRAEQRFAEDLIRGQIIHTQSFPIWDAPNSGFFGVPPSDAGRAPLDEALTIIRDIDRAVEQGADPRDDIFTERFARAEELLEAVGYDQGIDRAVVLYHRALLNIWRGDFGAAVSELDKLFARIENDLSGNPILRRLPETSARVQGARIASLYARGYAQLRREGGSQGARRAAEKDFREALALSRETYRGMNSPSGPFVTLAPERHLVRMSTSSIWNELIKVISLDEHNGVERAIRVSAPLIQSPSYLRLDPVLAANLMMLVAVRPPDAETLEDRRNRINALGRAMERADVPANAAARQRADVARVIAGLSIPPQRTPAQESSSFRRAFGKIHPSSGAMFQSIEIPGAQNFAAGLDAWLFIREWRILLGKGDLAGFEDSYTQLRRNRDVNMKLFDDWRADAMRVIRARLDKASRNLALGREERRQVFSTLVRSNLFYSPNERLQAALVYAFGGWWPLYVAGWLLAVVLTLAILWVLDLYRATAEPHHHMDRQRARAKEEWDQERETEMLAAAQ